LLFLQSALFCSSPSSYEFSTVSRKSPGAARGTTCDSATLDTEFTGFSALSIEEQEYVTTVFYHHPQQFRILNAPSDAPRRAALSFVVDTIEELRCVEATLCPDEVEMEAEQ
jgi:hypothetical protein